MPLIHSTHSKVTTGILAQCFSARSPHIQQSCLFHNMSQYHGIAALNSKTDFCQSRALFSHAVHCHNPALFDAIQSGDTIRHDERCNPASQSGQINITLTSYTDSERLSLTHGSSSATMVTGTQGNLFSNG